MIILLAGQQSYFQLRLAQHSRCWPNWEKISSLHKLLLCEYNYSRRKMAPTLIWREYNPQKAAFLLFQSIKRRLQSLSPVWHQGPSGSSPHVPPLQQHIPAAGAEGWVIGRGPDTRSSRQLLRTPWAN